MNKIKFPRIWILQKIIQGKELFNKDILITSLENFCLLLELKK